MDPTTFALAFATRHLDAVSTYFGLSNADVRFVATTIGALSLCVAFLRLLSGRHKRQETIADPSANESLRSIRRQRMPRDI
ncbi:hypothetical protein [Pontivivens nitratireducens]|uniref:Uncharacterized protein n=1 Tax=Pontivivens nitratireducens TaxID=2758038 RepID=A0A6G7VMJ6_9RHOB|nr:hypothetical protein [Pontibrevibacter nitratireducens]QIK41130.1 hypothetical protein G8E03_10340 [Pontibrevibacter nitratireducens]